MKLRNTPISIPAEHVWLDGLLSHAPDVRGLALLLQPNAVDHSQSRETVVARILQEAGFATLILDLLTRTEDNRDPDARYNVPQMANRILAVCEWIAHQPMLSGLPIGLVACGTASGAAIRAAAREPERFAAIVCRAGRPDLAGAGPLRALQTPVRFVVGSEDPGLPIIARAYEHLTMAGDWRNVEGAGELFFEPGALDAAAHLTADWLAQQMPAAPVASPQT